jgi:hypothetical protein
MKDHTLILLQNDNNVTMETDKQSLQTHFKLGKITH